MISPALPFRKNKHSFWLHPQDKGDLLYVSNNAVYRIDSAGKIQLLKNNIGSSTPSFKFSGNSITIWGIWIDKKENIYVAVFSDQAVKRISPDGKLTDVYKSKGNWAPLHGVFDNDGNYGFWKAPTKMR